MQEILNKILKKEPIVEYITTGDEILDKRIMGYQKGELITIASRPKFGKTAFALNSVVDNIKKGKKVFYAILGETSETIIAKILSQMLDVPVKDILLGTYNEIETIELQNAIDIISEFLILEEDLFVDIEYLFNRSFGLCDDIELLVIDGMEYLKSLCDNVNIIKSIKEEAYKNQIPIILLTSININVEKRVEKRPRLCDINNAQDISEYSDKVIVIYSDDYYKEKSEAKKERISKSKGVDYKSTFINKPVIEKEIIILKNSFGMDATLKREFKKMTASFVNQKISETKIEIVYE